MYMSIHLSLVVQFCFLLIMNLLGLAKSYPEQLSYNQIRL